MKYGYYPGCSLLSGAKEYDRSLRAVFEALGIEMQELDDWSCCGAVHANVENREATVTLPARNLALAEAQGFEVVIAPCSGCYKNLRLAGKAIAGNRAARKQVNESLGDDLQIEGDVEVLHPLYVILNEVGIEGVKERVTRPLTGLKVGSYYGCMLTRPKDEFDSPERPRGMDRLMEALGAELVDYPLKAKCCGGALALSHAHVTAKLTGNVLVSARDAGADVVSLACPMCHTALDAYQAKAERAMGRTLDLPVLYFTQLMGLALGLDERSLGLNRHIVPTDKIVLRVA
ncbi:MAG: CoB--CoM heterodisulfide reductase iron-sulfur subunit B family protein [Anaerolineales bacterium]